MINSVHSTTALGFARFQWAPCCPQQPGDQLASVEFGELVTFTPFPKRSAPWTKKHCLVQVLFLGGSNPADLARKMQ